MKWEKAEEGVVRLRYGTTVAILTLEELEKGLRIAKEGPVFEGTHRDGYVYRFQKQNGTVMCQWGGAAWVAVDGTSVSVWSDSGLEAILKARRS